MAKKKKNPELFVTGRLPLMFLRSMTALYVFFMMVIYPLYFEDKYFNMGEAKWNFFKVVTFTGLSVFVALLIWYIVELYTHKELKAGFTGFIKGLSVTDYFVIAYLIAVLLSSAFSPYKEYLLWGVDGWYMGLIAQICFVLIYFFVSRFYRWDPFVIACYFAGAAYVFLMGVLMRFNIDPMLMYQGVEEQYKVQFLSTLGQATWYSSYLVIMLPLGLFAFWYYDNKWLRITAGIFSALSFMTLVTQNSDSAFLGLAGLLFMLFWLSFESSKSFARFLECLILCVASFKFMGLCQVWFADKMVWIEKLSTTISQSKATWIVLIALVVIYVVYVLIDKKVQIPMGKIKFIRYIALGLVIVGMIAVTVYIYMNTNGLISPEYASDNNYLVFDEFWGNNRGSSWMTAGMVFRDTDILTKLFGAGPDCFYYIVYTDFADVLTAKWGEDLVLVCAHNEWLNALINVGIVGVVSYIGIFVSSVKNCTKNAKVYPEVLAISMAVVAYMAHNFFCYQQIICTPIIFILMGIGEEIIRKGYTREQGIL